MLAHYFKTWFLGTPPLFSYSKDLKMTSWPVIIYLLGFFQLDSHIHLFTPVLQKVDFMYSLFRYVSGCADPALPSLEIALQVPKPFSEVKTFNIFSLYASSIKSVKHHNIYGIISKKVIALLGVLCRYVKYIAMYSLGFIKSCCQFLIIEFWQNDLYRQEAGFSKDFSHVDRV